MNQLALTSWLDLLEREYLDSFLKEGGGAIKFALVDDEPAAARVADDVARRAAAKGFVTAGVDAAATRLHMLQDIFFAIARQLPWERLVDGFLQRLYQERGFQTSEQNLGVGAVAAASGVELNLLRQELRAALTEKLVKRGDVLAKDFRWAMFGLAATRAELLPERDLTSVIEWLQGDLRLVSAVKDFHLFRKIARHNARGMLASLGGWLRMAGLPGLVVQLDLQRLAVARRTEVPEGSIYYTRLALMDCFEVLRQLIDDTEDLSGMLIVAIAHRSLLDPDNRRGVRIYRALEERIWPDVTIKGNPNPLSSLVSLTTDRVTP